MSDFVIAGVFDRAMYCIQRLAALTASSRAMVRDFLADLAQLQAPALWIKHMMRYSPVWRLSQGGRGRLSGVNEDQMAVYSKVSLQQHRNGEIEEKEVQARQAGHEAVQGQLLLSLYSLSLVPGW